jgi:hypothetical protein
MRSFFLASSSAATLLIGFSIGEIAIAQPSSGSYQNTCQHPTIVNGTLTAECTDSNHQLHVSSLPAYLECQGDISNQNGVLNCTRQKSSAATSSVNDNNNRQRANSRDTGGRPNNLGSGDYVGSPRYNDNQYNGGETVDLNNNGQRGINTHDFGHSDNFDAHNNGDSRRNYDNQYNRGREPNGDQTQNNLYSHGFSYPNYGDPRYGDPRFDPRFAQGGYAYGRQPNQWIPIAERGPWLEQRIARGQREGTVDRREARGLRQELSGILSLENRYRREGMNPRKYTDLNRRFDLLAARIQYERNDGDHPRDVNRR